MPLDAQLSLNLLPLTSPPSSTMDPLLNLLKDLFYYFFPLSHVIGRWMDVATSFGSCAYQILVSSEDSGGDDSQEKADHIQHHRGPQQTVQVDHVPAAADPCELIVLCVVLCAGRQQWSMVTCAHVFITRI